MPIIATRDKGQNYITVTVNSLNNVPEVTTLNNTVTQGVYIYEDEATPIYPYNYAIINKPIQKVYASSANPFSPSTQYVMEMDTTMLFNSPLMVTKFVTSVGGLLEFDPGFSYRDGVVYCYWRASVYLQHQVNITGTMLPLFILIPLPVHQGLTSRIITSTRDRLQTV